MGSTVEGTAVAAGAPTRGRDSPRGHNKNDSQVMQGASAAALQGSVLCYREQPVQRPRGRNAEGLRAGEGGKRGPRCLLVRRAW